MAGIFDRLRGGSEGIAKVPIWPLYSSFWQISEGYLDRNGLLARFDITATSEVADIDALLGVVAASTAGQSGDQLKQTRIGLFHELWNVLVCIERGYLTEAQARTRLGI